MTDPSLGSLQAWADQHEKRDDDRFDSLGSSIDALAQSIRNGTIILVCGMTGIIGYFVMRDMMVRPAYSAPVPPVIVSTSLPPITPVLPSIPVYHKR